MQSHDEVLIGLSISQNLQQPTNYQKLHEIKIKMRSDFNSHISGLGYFFYLTFWCTLTINFNCLTYSFHESRNQHTNLCTNIYFIDMWSFITFVEEILLKRFFFLLPCFKISTFCNHWARLGVNMTSWRRMYSLLNYPIYISYFIYHSFHWSFHWSKIRSYFSDDFIFVTVYMCISK